MGVQYNQHQYAVIHTRSCIHTNSYALICCKIKTISTSSFFFLANYTFAHQINMLNIPVLNDHKVKTFKSLSKQLIQSSQSKGPVNH